MGFWQFATGGGSGGGTGDVVGPASSTDNAIVRFDGATGKLLQNSDVTVSDVAAGVVTLATTKGNALAIKNTDPDATTGASVAGDPLTITAGAAVASTDTAGAAAGGSVTITAGAAARNTSGNANGGDINLTPGAGIGTGTIGSVILPSTASIKVNSITGVAVNDAIAIQTGSAGANYRLSVDSGGGATNLVAYAGGTVTAGMGYQGLHLASGSGLQFHSGAVLTNSTGDTIISRIAAGQVAVKNGTNGMANNIKIATTTVNLAGATTTATGLFPATCIRLGVTARVTTIVTSGDGGTSFNVGDGTDADRYGATIGFAAGTTVDMANATADPSSGGWVGTAGDVVFTCVGGTFNGGVVRVCAHYLDLTAPTS